MNRYVIGIDPDSDRSGYGVVNVETREVVTLGACDFPTLLDILGVWGREASVSQRSALSVYL